MCAVDVYVGDLPAGIAAQMMVIIGVAFWIGWHVIQLRQEGEEVAREMQADAEGDEAREAIDRY